MIRLNAYLDALGLLNCGADHASDYCTSELSAAGDLSEALEAHFGAVHTSVSPPQPAANWRIQLGPAEGEWKHVLSQLSRRWFFGQLRSPTVNDEWVKDGVVDRFIELVAVELGDVTLQEVHVTPPMFYDLEWQDFALTSERGRWLLHFGWSD